jgi:hypothetical protein
MDVANEACEVVALNDCLTGPGRRIDIRYWMSLPLRKQSLFNAAHSKIYYMKKKWTVPKRHTYVSHRGVKTAHPLLMISTTFDSVCPLWAARSANEAFEGSRFVEVDGCGCGHFSVAVASVCVARHLRDILYEGKLLPNYTKCEVDSPYLVRVMRTAGWISQRQFDDSEEQNIHFAQVENQ